VRYNIENENENVWYNDKPLGENSIGDFMKNARQSLLIKQGKISNYIQC